MRRHRPTHQEPGVIGRDIDPEGPVPTQHRNPKGWEQRARQRQDQTLQMMALLRQLTAHMGGILTLAKAPPLNDVLGQMSQFIPANGVLQKGWSQNFESVTVTNFGTSQVTVTAQGLQSEAPSVGSGVAVVPAGVERTLQLRGLSVNIYGTPGSLVELVAYSRPRPPQASPCVSGASAQLVPVATPAAGAEFSVSPSPNSPFNIVAAQYTLATSATAGSRDPGLAIGPLFAWSDATQAASLTTTYSWWPGSVATVGGATVGPGIPPGPFPAGTIVASNIFAIEPGDQVSAITLMIETA
jgi:hypothetical protein